MTAAEEHGETGKAPAILILLSICLMAGIVAIVLHPVFGLFGIVPAILLVASPAAIMWKKGGVGPLTPERRKGLLLAGSVFLVGSLLSIAITLASSMPKLTLIIGCISAASSALLIGAGLVTRPTNETSHIR